MLTIGGRAVLELDLAMPRSRAWVATGEVEGTEPLSGRVEFVDDGATVFSGTVLDSQSYGARTGFRIVGGAGGLSTVVRAQSYRQAPASLPILDILQQAGDELSGDAPADSGLEWATGAWEASRALDDLAEHLGIAWWVEPLGGVRFGHRVGRAVASSEYEIESEDTRGRVVTLAPAAGYEWGFAPGDTIGSRTLSSVRYLLGASALRVECRYSATDLASLIEAIVLRHVRKLDYLALYPATVHSQDGDGNLQVFPDDQRIPGIVGVPIRRPFPGSEVSVSSGARVLLGFEGGDPSKPYALGWGGDGLVSVDVGGTRPFARVGDPVTVFMTPAVPVAVSGTISGAPFTGIATFASSLPAVIGAGSTRFRG